MRSRSGIGSLVIVFLAIAPLTTSASVVARLSLDQMVAMASNILVGRVVSQESYWEGGIIATYVELEVSETYKGSFVEGQHVTIYQHGGAVGDLTMIVPGEPTFRTGEDVLLFLEDRGTDSQPLVLGMSQGKFEVTVDPGTGLRMVGRNLEGLELLEIDVEAMELLVPSACRSVPVDPESSPETSERRRRECGEDLLTHQTQRIPLDLMEAEIERLLQLQEVQ